MHVWLSSDINRVVPLGPPTPPPTSHVGEIRGQIALPGYAGTASLSSSQQPARVISTASGMGNVATTGPLTVSVSLTLTGITGQTAAHLHMGGKRW